MILSKKRSDKSDAKMNGIIIKEKQSFRYLGVQIDSKLSFTVHITKIENKLSMFCGMYYRLRKVLGKDHLCETHFTIRGFGLCVNRKNEIRIN